MPCSALTRRPGFLFWLFLLLPLPAFAQTTYAPPVTARERVALDGGAWRYQGRPLDAGIEQVHFDDHAWQVVTLPHTWNSKTNSQTHKAAWYRTHFALSEADRGRETFLLFEGAATIADVYLNGKRLGQHRGAYTRFIFRATPAAVYGGDNVLAVKCDNDPKDTADCLPAGSGFQLYHVYGGLYRPVWLLKTAPVHIDPTDDAASGVFLTPQAVSAQEATLGIKTLVRNDTDAAQTVTVTNTVCDGENHVVAAVSEALVLRPHSGGAASLRVPVSHPRLWSPADPYLYPVYTETRAAGKTTDCVAERAGFRTLRMTPDGFTLNDVLTPLRGVAKHQETEERASAVTPADLTRDWDDLGELGVNYVRLAHYPHAALEYDLADARGVVVWAENGHSNSGKATATGDQITREMVRQNYNHPSICFWSIGNEAIQHTSDIATLEHYAHVVRAEDPTRLIAYASNSLFHESPALDFVAVNRYDGWYYNTISAFDAPAERYHFVSETGAGGAISTHTAAPLPTHILNFYEPEEYQQEVAESRCQTAFRAGEQIALFTWWTFRDFGDPRYKGVNSKGLETYGGFRKDIWYLFQSFLRPATPVVHLCGKTWFLRRPRLAWDVVGIKAYSNAAALTLTLNGQNAGAIPNGQYVLPDSTRADNVFFWNAPLKRGRNEVVVSDGQGHSDSAVLYFEAGDQGGLVRNLESGNPANPAYFINAPVHSEWPFYDNFDGTGDNTFHVLPNILQGAGWITTACLNNPVNRADLTFTLAPDAGSVDVFLMFTPAPTLPTGFLSGFADTGVTGTWRDNDLNLVPYALYRRTVPGGAAVHLPGATLDYVVLVKPHSAGAQTPPK